MNTHILIAAIGIAGWSGAAHAVPNEADIGSALVNVLGEYAPSTDAVTLEACNTVNGQTGYVCTYRIDECFGEDDSCDSPDVARRAAFVGGDNGWLAFDMQNSDDGYMPRPPLHAGSSEMGSLTTRWLEGAWNTLGNCENDGTFSLYPGGRFVAMGEAGRWTLEDSDLVITVTAAAQDDGEPPTPLETPSTTRWTIHWLGTNVGGVTNEEGDSYSMVRCS